MSMCAVDPEIWRRNTTTGVTLGSQLQILRTTVQEAAIGEFPFTQILP